MDKETELADTALAIAGLLFENDVEDPPIHFDQFEIEPMESDGQWKIVTVEQLGTDEAAVYEDTIVVDRFRSARQLAAHLYRLATSDLEEFEDIKAGY